MLLGDSIPESFCTISRIWHFYYDQVVLCMLCQIISSSDWILMWIILTCYSRRPSSWFDSLTSYLISNTLSQSTSALYKYNLCVICCAVYSLRDSKNYDRPLKIEIVLILTARGFVIYYFGVIYWLDFSVLAANILPWNIYSQKGTRCNSTILALGLSAAPHGLPLCMAQPMTLIPTYMADFITFT